MTLSRNLCWAVPLLAVLAAVPGLTAKAPPKASARASFGALRAGQDILISSPQFVVHALWFKSNDETGWYWTGSDEVYAVFSDMNPTLLDHITAVYGNVDEGETKNFAAADRCMAARPSCAGGASSLNIRFSFWERDEQWAEFCYGDLPGVHANLMDGKCNFDDFIGNGSIIHSQDQLLAMLPAVGDSREFTAVMDKNAGIYRFRYRITRLPNVERSIVIHLPPDLGLPPSISLQATAMNDSDSVRLTWTGASTATVDVYRNGTLIVTTPNDGSHIDSVVPGTYQYRLCNSGSTTACSAQIQAVVS